MSRPLVTVAICTYNRADMLRDTLVSFEALQVPASHDWELIVVNNACTDNTDAVVAEAAARGRLPVRSVLEMQPGQSYARNRALREARGEVIFWTDDDVIVEPSWIVKLLGAGEQEGADIVFGRSRPRWLCDVPAWFSPLHYGRFAILDYGDDPFVVTEVRQSFFGLNLGTRRSSLEQLGGFEVTLGYGPNGGAAGEDTELCERALAAGMKILYVPDAFVDHVIPVPRTTKAFYRRRMASATERDYHRLGERFPGVPWALGLPRFMFRRAVADFFAFLMGIATGAADIAFDRELKLRQFLGYIRASARQSGARSSGSQPI